VVGELTLRWVQTGSVTDPFGNLVIRAGRIAADAQSADARLISIERHTAAKGNRAAADLALGLVRIVRRYDAFRVERIGLRNAPQRVSRLGQRIPPRRG